jgi:hypothetical protein
MDDPLGPSAFAVMVARGRAASSAGGPAETPDPRDREPTCPCPTLADEVARRASAAAADVLVVAPALNSRLRHWLSDVDEALARAQERLDLAITALRRRGVIVRGEIGDADPLLAIADALASFPADEIVIATLPAGQSNWIERTGSGCCMKSTPE